VADSAETGTDVERALARIQSDLEHIKQGLSLLGLHACKRCRRFFRGSDDAALFEWDGYVCYTCIGDWLTERSPELSVSERSKVEAHLTHWLCTHHGATVVRHPRRLPKNPKLQIVVACEACGGTGTQDHRRCSNCDGRGTEWVVVPEPELG
jgi:hypothetical protein